jgi:flagellar hook-associated protein 3 FlgL
MYQQTLTTMLGQQNAVAHTQNEVTGGKRINLASDDPGGASQVVTLNHVLAGTAQYSANIDAANTRLSTESSTLDSINSLLDQARSLAVSGINGSLSDADRDTMATQLTQIRAQLVQMANATDANGMALFAGTSTSAAPFVLNADGSVTYQGDDGYQMVAIGSGLKVPNGDPGGSLLMDLPAGNGSFVAGAAAGNTGTLLVGATSVADIGAWQAATAGGAVDYQISFDGAGNWTATDSNNADAVIATGTYAEGGSISFNGMDIALTGNPDAGDSIRVQSGQTQDVFGTLTNMINALKDPSLGSAQFDNVINRQLEGLDRAQDSVLRVETEVGGRLDRLAQQQSTYADLTLTYKSVRSTVRDTDMASAISDLVLQSTALQASQQTFAKVQTMSLFDYIR